MNIVVFTLFLLGELFRASQTFKGERLKAVTQFPTLQQYYELIKTQGRRRNFEIDVDIKENICHYIIVNPFFDMNDQKRFRATNRSEQKWLKKNYRTVFKEFFKRSKHLPGGPSCIRASGSRNKRSKYTFLNPNQERTVVVEGDLIFTESEYYNESVFVCLSKHQHAKTIKKYFVSAEDYNVNRAINANGVNEYVAGRFVFTELAVTADVNHDEDGGGQHESKLLQVYALAEESGQMFRRGEMAIEQFYLAKKRKRETTERAEDDPVCILSPDEKLRLCAIVMSSPPLESQGYEFQPQSVFLEADCRLRELSFKSLTGLQTADDSEYKEWTIGCQVKNVENMYESFYVSRGYAPNCAYVYKPVFGFVFLHLFQDNVSVLRD